MKNALLIPFLVFCLTSCGSRHHHHSGGGSLFNEGSSGHAYFQSKYAALYCCSEDVEKDRDDIIEHFFE